MENPQVTQFTGRGLLAPGCAMNPSSVSTYCFVIKLTIKLHPLVLHDVKVSWFSFVRVSIKQFNNKSSADAL